MHTFPGLRTHGPFKEMMPSQVFTLYSQKFIQPPGSSLRSLLTWTGIDVSRKGQRIPQQISSQFPAEDSPDVPQQLQLSENLDTGIHEIPDQSCLYRCGHHEDNR